MTPRRIERIDNGFDTQIFHPDVEDRRAVRTELGLGDETPLIGHVARFHPVKDQATLVEAMFLVVKNHPEAVLAMVGDALDPDNAELARLTEPLRGSVQLLGRRDDVPRLMRAFDVAVLSSAGEALPLVIGEAMASGVPFVSTDVGDARQVIGDSGRIVPVGDPIALAKRWERSSARLLGARVQMSVAARERIEAPARSTTWSAAT